MNGKRLEKGFTLVELLIVITIIGTLLAVGIPAYQNYGFDARRAEATAALTSFAAAMERHYTANNTYLGAGAGGADTGAPAIFATEAPLDSSTKSYDLTINAATATTYTLRATPKNAQTGNGILNLLSTGQKQWDEDNNGSIGTGEYDWRKN